MALEGHARLQERSLALEDREAVQALWRKQQELEAVDSEDATGPKKAGALRAARPVATRLKRVLMRVE